MINTIYYMSAFIRNSTITAASTDQTTDFSVYWAVCEMCDLWTLPIFRQDYLLKRGTVLCWLVHQWYGLKSKTHLALSFTINPSSNSWDIESKTNTLPLLERVLPYKSYLQKNHRFQTLLLVVFCLFLIVEAFLTSALPWATLTISWPSRHYDN